MCSLGENAFLWFFKMKNRFRSDQWSAFWVPTQRKTLTSVLICFPSKEINGETYRKFLGELFAFFPEIPISVVLHREQLNAVRLPQNATVFVYDERDFSRFHVMKRSWLAALPEGLALAVDLNESDSLWSAHLCYETHAPLRLSFDKETAPDFFNIVLRPREGALPQEKLEQMLQSIRALTEIQQELAA